MSEAVLHDAVHVARKPRQCSQCLRTISAGQRYRRQVHTYGRFTTYVAHEDCDAAAEHLRALNDALLPEEGVLLHSDIYEPDDADVIRDLFPAVAVRLRLV